MLKFNKNSKFGILLFGDLHEKIDYGTSQNFADMQKMMVAALEEFKPDLCVLLGDNFSSQVCKEDYDAFVKGVKALSLPIFDRNIPVAAIMGNHEHDHDCDDLLIKAYTEAGYIMRGDGVEGKADFYELIYSNDGEKPLACLWFLDSNNLCEDQSISHYDYVHTNQINWFEKISERLKILNGSKPMPAYIFQHTPVIEEYRLLRKAKFYEFPVSVKGHNSHSKTRYVAAKGTKGYVGEGPCTPDYNNGQFESWKKVGGVVAAFFGHDHLNDFSGYVDDIFIAQHKTAGFRAYTDGCRCCVRYVEIYENNPLKFTEKLKHFKEFGLKCECLGPIFKRITDRQSIILHTLGKILGILAVIFAIIFVVKKFI